MKPTQLLTALLLLIPITVLSAPPAAPRCETWQTGYSGTDATGPHVLGYWRFEPDAVGHDSSGKGNDLTLSGAQPAGQGKHGGALESFSGWPIEDKRNAAIAPAKPGLSPKGAFTLELWVKPKPALTAELQPVLVDKKYVSHTDYQLRLTSADKGGSRRVEVSLGFGDASELMISQPFKLTEEWHHIAFTYDGAGEAKFFHNGGLLGIVHVPGRGAIAPGNHPLSIGDRLGSTYAGFPGFIDDVRLCSGALEFRPVEIEFHVERKTWRRMENGPTLGIVVHNLTQAAVSHLQLRTSLEGIDEKKLDVPDLAPGAEYELNYPFDTSLRPDTYRLKVHLELPGEIPFVSDEELELILAARPVPNRMPVMMWGIGGGSAVRHELARLKDIGFTHCLGSGADYAAIWAAGKPIPPGTKEQIREEKTTLDFALANDFGIAMSLSPGQWLKGQPQLARRDRAGKPYTRTDVNAALPGLSEFCFNVGASVAQTYGAFPAWQAALIDSEARDDGQVSFSDFDREAYRKFAGSDIPDAVVTKSGVDWSKLKDFPLNRTIPDDHPLLKFYRWYWTNGDGWNALHTAVHRGLKSTGREDVWTWFDPAIRAPSIGGSGGGVDVLGQWTYTYPDPLRIGYFTDELRAMAANSPQHPRVMKMTQLIMYRSQTAPKLAAGKHILSPFDDHDPDAAYITTAPMHVREAFWTEIARPISGIMYHGWQSLVPTDSIGGYRYTHPDTQNVLRSLLHGVVEPLGPTLLQVGDRKSDIAYLDSFTAQMFAHRGSYGYSSDEAYLTLLYAQLQPEVIYEQGLLQNGLDGYKVLVLADCDVLPETVVQRIGEFQRKGGIVIGDENLAPAIKPNLVIPKMTRTKKGDVDKATLLANAARLRASLDAKYTRHADSSNPEVIVRCRAAGDCEYVFVVNDRREFGTYIGQHGLVMENGLPSDAELSLDHPAGHVYDLINGREIKASVDGSRLRWPVNLGPCEGRIFLVSPRPIVALELNLPESVSRGGSFKLSARICDPGGLPIPGVIPLQVQISDPAGRAAEFSGYYGARDGQLEIPIDIARNDASGVWQVHVRELASGIERSVYIRVQP